ncbi:unnamed protein product [Psylliodes chrysocephalus]|uniref:Uncharacterized protein n=1 Tax=Psylliodes chrysocephalus TaxID=3402493 RepID=A0A9P0DA07_9CUCU|nr:unnamed protein product [Psylliodes chrysocephala]
MSMNGLPMDIQWIDLCCLGLHAVNGCDYIPALYCKEKKKPLQIVLQNEEFQDAFINNEKKAFPCLNDLCAACKAELNQQLLRVSYVADIWCNAHLKVPTVLASHHGWDLSDDGYTFKWFDGEAMPNTINEIVLLNIETKERNQEEQETTQTIEQG